MKRIDLLLLTPVVALTVASCRRDTEPERQGNGTYADAGRATEAVEGLYHMGAPTFFGERGADDTPVMALGGYLSGLFESGTTTGAAASCRQLAMDDATLAGYLRGAWEAAGTATDRATEAIENLPQTPGLEEDKKVRLVAEARFFRAFNRFTLVRMFGCAPAAKASGTAQSTPGGQGVGQPATLAESYDQIVDDLKKAVAALPDEPFAASGGRVGRPAAQMLLADVYLTMSGYPLQQDSYREAAAMARKVIAGGKHALAPNGPTPETSAYNALRTQGDNAECIYGYRAPEEHSLAPLSLPADATRWGVVRATARNGFRPTEELLGMYDPVDDLRARERQFFHSFVKYPKGERTVIQTFAPLPYLWFDRETLFGSEASASAEATATIATIGAGAMIYRYAETLLIAAEAIARSEGVTAEAAGCLADVRARAYTKTDRQTICDTLAALSCEEFLEQVWTERLREFPLEMKIWTDVQRTRKYPVAASGGQAR